MTTMKKFIQMVKVFFGNAISVCKSLFCRTEKQETEDEKYRRLEAKFAVFETVKVSGVSSLEEAICRCWSCEFIHGKGWDIFNLTDEQRKEVDSYGQGIAAQSKMA